MASPSTQLLRTARKTHRSIASVLFIFFFILSTTGFLLGWKNLFNKEVYKNKDKAKVEKDMGKWMPLGSLQLIAQNALHEKTATDLKAEVERIDIRPGKAYISFQFADNYTVVLNPANGIVQQVDKRYSGLLLKIHEGSLVDDWLGTGFFKKTYTSVMGLSFFFLTLTGTWLWLKTRSIKRKKAMAL